MTVRTELPCVQIPLTRFQEFDQGMPIDQELPTEWKLESDDIVNWECAQFDGQAVVISCDEPKGKTVFCTLEKIS